MMGSTLVAMWCTIMCAAAPADSELAWLARHVPGFAVIDLPAAPQRVELSANQALTVDKLRGVALDDNPPKLREPRARYDARWSDDLPPGVTPPYVAHGIAPFRFRHFTNEFNYTGWHNFDMQDYAATHGFGAVAPYVRTKEHWNNLPEGTLRLQWGESVNWVAWMAERGIATHRYDQLADRDLLSELGPWYDGSPLVMLDLEHWLAPPRDVQGYPHDADQAQRAAWERRYYQGYAKTLIASAQAVRRDGARSVGIYGWQPFSKTWFGLETAVVEPGSYWAWQAFGKSIYRAYDVMYPDLYCFYFDPANVAFTLANIDFCRKLIDTESVRKPMRPYYWALLHGGSAKYHWWKDQPIYSEEARARTALAFFAGVDGIVEWNWSDIGSHIKPPPIKPGVDVMVGQAFDDIQRYDVIHIDAIDEAGQVRFRRNVPDSTAYTTDRDKLQSHLRPLAEPIAAVVEGLALVKPLEYILRHGEVMVDVSAQKQFAKKLPIVRRVKLGNLHVIATYDPAVVYGGTPRQVVLTDFDGNKGLTLTLPADDQTRLYLVRQEQ